MATYIESALAAAHASHLTAAEFRGLGYEGVAAAAGVTIEKDGSSPRDFIYRNVRLRVASKLRQEEIAAKDEADQSAIEAAIKSLPGMDKTTVSIGDDGLLKIIREEDVTKLASNEAEELEL